MRVLRNADLEPNRSNRWIKDMPWEEGFGQGEVYGYYWKCPHCGGLVKGGYASCGDNFCKYCGEKIGG